jgi:hypothetical protein
MNPQIRELYRQAHTDGFFGMAFDPEKFAQLIIGECMKMCEVAQVGYLTHGLEKEAAGAYSVKQYIEEYLGVES